MKSKLLLSSALISGLALAGSAVAETKISGNLDISLGSRSANTAQDSSSGFGSETQINISNSGDLNNGMSYSAGFSLESDSNAGTAGSGTDGFEGTYLNINLAEGSMLHFGSDKFPALDGTVTPKVSVAADTLVGNGSGGTGGLYVDGSALDIVEKQGVGFLQDLGGMGNVGIYYTPNAAIDGNDAANDTVNFTETTNSGIGYQFRGNLGVEGLTVLLGEEKVDATGAIVAGTNEDRKARNIGVSYNFGQFTVGASQIDNDQTDGTEHESKEYGATFAVNDNLSIGISYHETEDSASTSTADEEITMVQAGYNLGGVYMSVNYAQMENRGGLAANGDDDFASLRLGTKF
jgi:hypothetical protein